jgi:hypothetical protein
VELVLHGLLAQLQFGGDLFNRKLILGLHDIDPAHLAGQLAGGVLPDMINLFNLVLFVGLGQLFGLFPEFVHKGISFPFGGPKVIVYTVLDNGIQIITERRMDDDGVPFMPEPEKYFL